MKPWKIVVAGVAAIIIFIVGWWIGTKGFVWPDLGSDDAELERLGSEIDRLIERDRIREAEHRVITEDNLARIAELEAGAERDRLSLERDARDYQLLEDELRRTREGIGEAINTTGRAEESTREGLEATGRQGDLIRKLKKRLEGLPGGGPEDSQ